MATKLNYYTNEEAHKKMCPRVEETLIHGELAAAPLNIHCIGDRCANWWWDEELNDLGQPQGICGMTSPRDKLK